jgi:hypothetical protein
VSERKLYEDPRGRWVWLPDATESTKHYLEQGYRPVSEERRQAASLPCIETYSHIDSLRRRHQRLMRLFRMKGQREPDTKWQWDMSVVDALRGWMFGQRQRYPHIFPERPAVPAVYQHELGR